MKQPGRAKRRFPVVQVAALFLIVFSLFMAVASFKQYSRAFIQTQRDYLFHLAESVDHNISNLLDRYEDDMAYLSHHSDLTEAVQLWRKTGRRDVFLQPLEESTAVFDESIAAVLVVHRDQVIASTNGKLHYVFSDSINPGTLRSCVDVDGSVYFAVTSQASPDLFYAALIDLDRFYDRLVGPTFLEHNWILLTDTHCQVLLYQQQKQACVDRLDQVDGVTGATSGQEGVDIFLDNQKKQLTNMTAYEYFDGSTQESYTARMAVVPSAASENGVFAVGVVTNYEADSAALDRAVFHLILCVSLLFLSIILLISTLLIAMRRDTRELTRLRQKNEQIEELNRKMQELTHHQRLETIGTLSSSIAHEFNNLLTPIMGYSIMVLEKLPPEEEELYDSMLEIYQASQKAKTIISRLSDLSRKNTGLSYQYVRPDELCRKVLDIAAPACPEGVEVRLDTDTSGLYLYGNETQLSQLLLNLVLNAIHAMEQTGGILTLSTFSVGDSITLQVTDTGTGIPPEVLPRVFEPFFTTKESGKGTGLGLAIVHQIVEEHKGTIKVDSLPGRGTTISVVLPLHMKPETTDN